MASAGLLSLPAERLTTVSCPLHVTKIQGFHILVCVSFSPEFYCNHTKIQGFTIQCKKIFLFHQNFTAIFLGLPQASRSPLLRQRMFFFSPEFCSRPYQNSGHTGGSFFFTRILSPTILKFRDILMKKKHLLKIYKQSSYVLTIRPRLAFCHRQPRG